MTLVPVDLAYIQNLEPDRIAVFAYSDEICWAVRQAGFGFVVIEGGGMKKILAVGRKSDLVGKARSWDQPFTHEIPFEVERASTAAGWFVRFGASSKSRLS